MNPRWRVFWVGLAGSVLAIACGWWIANGSYALPLIIGAIGAGACLVAFSRLRLDVAVLGILLVGYIVGNRGFAQFLLFPGLPLLPAEAGLALCGFWLCFSAAFQRRLPVERDGLNFAIGAWIAISSIRILPDLRLHGALALRDFAIIYYGLFLFIAQAQAAEPKHRRFLETCLLVATVATIPLVELFRRFPDFFVSHLTIRGIPLIFFKGDLVATSMAIGVLLTHRRWEQTRKIAWLIVAVVGMVGVILSENRASLLGLMVATGWLALRGRWSLLRTQLIAGFAVLLIAIGSAVFGAAPARQNFFVQIVERIGSISDVGGGRTYSSAEMESKSDNNRFRLVWWRAVIDETTDQNPWIGLGFGHDLAAAFVRRYYPDSDDEFTARSPHSILITLFGRTGLVGVLPFLLVVAAMIRRTWQAFRVSSDRSGGETCWLAAWVVFISACFGVVLEGPMGAVVFWSLLGLANGATRSDEAATPAIADPAAPGLPAPDEPAEVLTTT